jgi:hypothetical protein
VTPDVMPSEGQNIIYASVPAANAYLNLVRRKCQKMRSIILKGRAEFFKNVNVLKDKEWLLKSLPE